jgi:hypothetical protein
VVGCCECGDESSGSCATELVMLAYDSIYDHSRTCRKSLLFIKFWNFHEASCFHFVN